MKPHLRTIGIAAAVLATLTVGAALVDLTAIPHGLTFEGPDGHAYRVRPNAWVTRITGHDATSIGGTVHLAWPRGGRLPPSSYLMAHEWRHLWQRRTSPENPHPTRSPLFEFRAVVGGRWTDSIESSATSWGMAHRNDAHFVFVARFLAERVVSR